ncbi:MAG TPA: NAD(P)/FAD-dependent oxidoreductase [Phycisphaerae bacterium]|nr:NAD(P)/FAD-dependent oxidoreductase [Phycisphaerae bacterium]
MNSKERRNVVIIGAGPAGLTAAYELSKHGIAGTILESDTVVGGLARTLDLDGYRFDIGAHRFFTKVMEIQQLWDEMLGEPLATCPRLTRILYGGKFYEYPLKAGNALKNMGVPCAIACVVSYAWSKIRPLKSPRNFEEWVINQFGAKLYNMFFKSYTEKVWGCPCTEIGADWAAQRIKGLNLGEAILNAFRGQRQNGAVKTLIDEFRYPRRGPGQLWEACASTVRRHGWSVQMQTQVIGIERHDGRAITVCAKTSDGIHTVFPADDIFSSMPLRELLLSITPSPPAEILDAASKLSYRDFLLVVLVLDAPNIFPDNWIYVHSPDVKVGRIDNFGNWTPEMLPNRSTSCLVMEYFVFEGDEIWSSTDDALTQLAYRELDRIGLAKGKLLKSRVVRMRKAYPVYDPGYKPRLDTIRAWLRQHVPNIHCLGRNGQHRYNNQDHSMATALIAARNVALGQERDPWSVNEDAEYHEIAKTERQAPVTPSSTHGNYELTR